MDGALSCPQKGNILNDWFPYYIQLAFFAKNKPNNALASSEFQNRLLLCIALPPIRNKNIYYE